MTQVEKSGNPGRLVECTSVKRLADNLRAPKATVRFIGLLGGMLLSDLTE